MHALIPRAVGVAAGLALAAAAVPPATGASSPSKASVSLKNIAFTPATVRVRTGGRVTWTWRDPSVFHNIHAIGKPRFPGRTARKTGTYTVRFTKAGTYRYECTLHPGMTGRVIVRR